MLDKIRNLFTRTQTIETYSPERLQQIGATLQAERLRLEKIRELPIEDQDLMYPASELPPATTE